MNYLEAKQRTSKLMFYVLKQGKWFDENIALSDEEKILVVKELGIEISGMGHL